jgi:hypothetical protein
MKTAIILVLLISPAWAGSWLDDYNTKAVETCLEQARQENAGLPDAKYFNAYYDPAIQSFRTNADAPPSPYSTQIRAGEIMKFAMRKCLTADWGWHFP